MPRGVEVKLLFSMIWKPEISFLAYWPKVAGKMGDFTHWYLFI